MTEEDLVAQPFLKPSDLGRVKTSLANFLALMRPIVVVDEVVLADPASPIRYVITVEALKEGWDCPFAYVLCSLQDMKSAKDVEQLLGRVLRMPGARARAQPELNKAYAHIVAQSFAQVANQLVDRLVQNMGFEAYEAALAIAPGTGEQPELLAAPRTPAIDESWVSLPMVPSAPVPAKLADTLKIVPTVGGGGTAIIQGEITDEIAALLVENIPARQKPQVEEAIEQARIRRQTQQAPGARGIPFAPIPQLCMTLDDALQPVEKRLLAVLGEFDLMDEPIVLAGFSARENGDVFEIDVADGQVRYALGPTAQLHLNEVTTSWTENDLVRWLDRECRQQDVPQASMLKWMIKTIQHLRNERGFTLTALIRGRYPLKEAALREIERRRRVAIAKGFQTKLPTFIASPLLEDRFQYGFYFHPTNYPGRPPFYRGRYRFRKHYYGVIHDLRATTEDGQPTEEFLCAQAIDVHPKVKHWVRNVEHEDASFRLPTSGDYFYPDFVCELHAGKLFAVEYKGEHLASGDDAREKAQIGHQWEATSHGRCLFLMATKRDDLGRDVRQQIDAKLSSAQAI